jgi:hypothetical protein
VVPPESPAALAEALVRMATLDPAERCAIGADARQRVIEHFGTERMVAETVRAYAGLGVS